CQALEEAGDGRGIDRRAVRELPFPILLDQTVAPVLPRDVDPGDAVDPDVCHAVLTPIVHAAVDEPGEGPVAQLGPGLVGTADVGALIIGTALTHEEVCLGLPAAVDLHPPAAGIHAHALVRGRILGGDF